MSEPMPLQMALVEVDEMEADERGKSTVGTPGDAYYRRRADALAAVLLAARENYAAKVIADTHRIVAEAKELQRKEEHRQPHLFRTQPRSLGYCVECSNDENHPIHRLDASKTPHLFAGRSGGTCYLCPHPKDHDIHPNRSAP